jgi:uncharacterized membrane protein YdbT with pleckstrin-like domain
VQKEIILQPTVNLLLFVKLWKDGVIILLAVVSRLLLIMLLWFTLLVVLVYIEGMLGG